jgi:hypothetical protein
MKTRHLFGSLIAIALLGAFLCVGAPSAFAQKTTTATTTVTKIKKRRVIKTGWWIRIDTSKTTASSIMFQAGLTRADRKDWRTWMAGEPAEFDLGEMREWPKLHLRMKTDPKKGRAVFCVFYGDHGVEHFNFDGDKDDNMRSTHTDKDCMP